MGAYTVGVACAGYAAHGQEVVVLEALGMTAGIFCVLTLFTFKSGVDFGFMGPALGAGLCMLLCYSISATIFGWHTGFMYAAFGAALFSGYIVYDTWRLSTVYGYDDYI